LQRVPHEIPIVFVETTDSVGRGPVASLAQPGGNTTGFTQFDFTLSGKWLELLKEIAPAVTHVGVIRDPTQFSGIAELAAIQAVAAARGVEVSAIDARDVSIIKAAVGQFARQSNGGLIVTPSGTSIKFRDRIAAMAIERRLPADLRRVVLRCCRWFDRLWL
jgi:putative ABC transport system substrate-binding protein